jgi:hypothetical protein
MSTFSEFQSSDKPFNAAYGAELLADNVMPTAILLLRRPLVRGAAFAVYSRRTNHIVGLPTFDLANLGPNETVERYIAHRLDFRFSLSVSETDLHSLPAESNESAWVEDLGNKHYAHAHRRLYIPVIGATAVQPRFDPDIRHNAELRFTDEQQIIKDTCSGKIGDFQSQLIDIHQELFNLTR